MFAALRQRWNVNGNIMDSSTYENGLQFSFIVVMHLDKKFCLVEIRNPGQRREGSSSLMSFHCYFKLAFTNYAFGIPPSQLLAHILIGWCLDDTLIMKSSYKLALRINVQGCIHPMHCMHSASRWAFIIVQKILPRG